MQGEDVLFGGGVGFEEVAAVDAWEDSGGQGWGEEFAFVLQEDVADGSFGELAALVKEEDFVTAFGAGFGEFAFVEVAVGGLVADEDVGGVGAFGGDADG